MFLCKKKIKIKESQKLLSKQNKRLIDEEPTSKTVNRFMSNFRLKHELTVCASVCVCVCVCKHKHNSSWKKEEDSFNHNIKIQKQYQRILLHAHEKNAHKTFQVSFCGCVCVLQKDIAPEKGHLYMYVFMCIYVHIYICMNK